MTNKGRIVSIRISDTTFSQSSQNSLWNKQLLKHETEIDDFTRLEQYLYVDSKKLRVCSEDRNSEQVFQLSVLWQGIE